MKNKINESLVSVHTHTQAILKDKGITLIALIIIIIILLILIGIAIISVNANNGILKKIKYAENEMNSDSSEELNNIEISCNPTGIVNDNQFSVLIEIKGKIGISKIEYPNGNVVDTKGKKQVYYDYTLEKNTEYVFKIDLSNGIEKYETIEINDNDLCYVNFYKYRTGAGTVSSEISSSSGNVNEIIAISNNQITVLKDCSVFGKLHYLDGGITPTAHCVSLYKNNSLLYRANPANRNIDLSFKVQKDDLIYITQYTDSSNYPVTSKAELIFVKNK